jgi:hypothetical protein
MKTLLALPLLATACVVNAGPPPSNNPAPPPPASTPAATASAAPATTGSSAPAPATSGSAQASGFQETEEPAEAPKESKYAAADGRPKDFKAGAAEALWIWQDAKGSHWHLRTTTKDKPHRFHGVAIGDGDLKGVKSVRTEAGDRFRVKGTKRASFDFNTDGASDGLDFDLDKTSCVRFVLFIDGKPAAPERIQLGKDAAHPQGHNFKLCP